jgi:uncharacterized protein YjbJ (UPF0337 family)
MDKDRVEGAVKQAKGAVKEAAGKVLGDAKMTSEGKADKVEGKVQNAVGGAKDAVREKTGGSLVLKSGAPGLRARTADRPCRDLGRSAF